MGIFSLSGGLTGRLSEWSGLTAPGGIGGGWSGLVEVDLGEADDVDGKELV